MQTSTFVVGRIDDGSVGIEDLARLWIPASEIFGMAVDKPVNAGPQHYIRNAAAWHLDHWVRDHSRPPTSPRLVMHDGAFVTDEVGNVKGGIRTPHVDVPTSVLSGLGNSGHPISFLCGSTAAFDDKALGALYPSKGDYLDRYVSATARSVEEGFVLAVDADEVIGIATANSPV